MTTPPTTEDACFAWLDGIAVAATVCDRQGTCLYLNDHAARLFAKDGMRKMIHQLPWFQDGVFSGVVELSFELPAALPHFVRDPA